MALRITAIPQKHQDSHMDRRGSHVDGNICCETPIGMEKNTVWDSLLVAVFGSYRASAPTSQSTTTPFKCKTLAAT